MLVPLKTGKSWPVRTQFKKTVNHHHLTPFYALSVHRWRHPRGGLRLFVILVTRVADWHTTKRMIQSIYYYELSDLLRLIEFNSASADVSLVIYN